MQTRSMILGAGLAALLAVPAIAQMGRPDGPDGRPPQTRAEVQARVQEMFDKADTNHDGVITKAEFDAARDRMKADMQARRGERRDERFAQLDTDKNGEISRSEFDAAPGPRDGGPGGDGPRHGHHGKGGGPKGGRMGDEWFARMDANKDGKVTLAEAMAGPLAMFDKADTNHDGVISPEEREAARAAMRAEWKAKRD